MTQYNAMTFFYGSYQHAPGEVSFESVSRGVQYSSTQRANILRETWGLKGKLVAQGAGSQAAIFASLAALKTAYSVNGQSAGFLDTNNNQTPLYLNNSNAIGGVNVLSPISHGRIEGAETVGFLHYKFALQMDSFLSKPTDLLSYSETLSFRDNMGQPLQIGRLPQNAPPIIQQITGGSFYYCTQSGSLTQRTPNPSPEAMLFPNSLIGEEGSKEIVYHSPRMQRGVALEYGVSWTYRYRQISPFTGAVHARG